MSCVVCTMKNLKSVRLIVLLFAIWISVETTLAIEISVGSVSLEQRVDDLARRLQLLETKCSTAAVVGSSERSESATILNANQIPRANCKRILEEDPSSRSGLYRIALTDSREFTVYCDMKTDGGGWTVIQQRVDNTTDFYRNCIEYKNGFGNLENNFWLGLERIHLLTHAGHNELLVRMSDDKKEAVSQYRHFSVADEESGYRLHIRDYIKDKSDGGDSLTFHHGYGFSAYDCDRDSSDVKNCAVVHHGGWWYRECFESNLNGRYYYDRMNSNQDGIIWHTFTGYNYSAKRVSMAIRSRD